MPLPAPLIHGSPEMIPRPVFSTKPDVEERQVEESKMPEPVPQPSSYLEYGPTPTPVVMPLPPASSVVGGTRYAFVSRPHNTTSTEHLRRGIREMASGYSLGGDSTAGQTIQDTEYVPSQPTTNLLTNPSQ